MGEGKRKVSCKSGSMEMIALEREGERERLKENGGVRYYGEREGLGYT